MIQIKWKKKGLIFCPSGEFEWSQEYAQVPTPIELDNCIRIFYTSRPKPINGMYISHVSYIDVNKQNPKEILYVHTEPVLELGGIGDFDEFGIHPCTLVKIGKLIYFYYQGWERGYSVPYKTSLGLAISNDNAKTFIKSSQEPLFSRTTNEPYLENGFFILKENEDFYMWYSSCSEWIESHGKLEPIYNIVYAHSQDGIHWQRNGKRCFEVVYEKEANGRPTVTKIGNIYCMWFCYRNVLNFRQGSGAYKIGFAYSENLLDWKRNDNLSGFITSENTWDSEMQAYPYIIEVQDKIFLFYNGNQFGKYGFGYAELEVE